MIYCIWNWVPLVLSSPVVKIGMSIIPHYRGHQKGILSGQISKTENRSLMYLMLIDQHQCTWCLCQQPGLIYLNWMNRNTAKTVTYDSSQQNSSLGGPNWRCTLMTTSVVFIGLLFKAHVYRGAKDWAQSTRDSDTQGHTQREKLGSFGPHCQSTFLAIHIFHKWSVSFMYLIEFPFKVLLNSPSPNYPLAIWQTYIHTMTFLSLMDTRNKFWALPNYCCLR